MNVRVLALAGVAALVAGCSERSEHGAGPTLPLPDWALEVDGAPAGTVTLPRGLKSVLPAAHVRVILRAAPALGEAHRGRDVTLSISHWPAMVRLRAAGQEVLSLEGSLTDRYRRRGPQRWVVPAALTGAPRLPLELEFEYGGPITGMIGGLPTLGADPAGTPAFRFVDGLNFVSQAICVGALDLMGLTYLFLFLLDRRRKAFGWFALQAAFSSVVPLHFLGALQVVLGEYDVAFAEASSLLALYASASFAHAEFGLGRLPRPLSFGLATMALLAIPMASPFPNATYYFPVWALTLTLGVAHIVVLYARLTLRRPRPPNALLFLGGWGFVLVASLPDRLLVGGVASLLGGVMLVPCAILGYAWVQSMALSREHVRSLHLADSLNADLAERLALLEAKNREVAVLNDELRRQVAERSRELGDALARLSVGEPPKPVSMAPGALIEGRYRVVRPLGAGAMGVVYEVERLTDGRRLALKSLLGRGTPAQLARFAREAQVAAELEHPNLVSVLDVGIAATGTMFLVMELVVGASLEQARTRFGEAAWAVPLLAQVASGLAAMHARGVVHRDLKPANILLAEGGGLAKIADFGLSSLGADAAIGDTIVGPEVAFGETQVTPQPGSEGLTHTGMVLGTPLYMAPELFAGAQHARPASDVYGFGVIAFEVLSGRLPWVEPPMLARMAGRAVATPVALATRTGTLEPGLLHAIERCLDLDPAGRPTAAALVAALTRS